MSHPPGHDLLSNPYPSRRSPVLARHGMVATSHPLAAQAGLRMLMDGGNAIDAAVATAAALTVLEPTANGLGGDAFALIWDGGRLHGINGSGRAPARLDPMELARAGHTSMPQEGWLSVTVPGAVRLWQDVADRFATMPMERLLQPAIAYAEDGAPVPPVMAGAWAAAVAKARQLCHGPSFDAFFATFAPGGAAPTAGSRFLCPGHARTLRALARDGADAFYRGEIAEALVHFSRDTGGLLQSDDLASHASEWVDPISVRYRSHIVHELPPNGQGIAALIALGILDGLDLSGHGRDSPEAFHLQAEAMRLAMADAHGHVADPRRCPVPVHGLLDPDYLAQRRALIGQRAGNHQAGDPPRGGTVYLCTADRDGRMVSLIQSNYRGFGSYVVLPGWGIALQNRGAGFSTAPGHPNRLEAGKRPFHTIIPGFLSAPDGSPIGPFGVMGGHMQPQGHVQLICNVLDYGMQPQAALDAPRWRCDPDGSLHLESSVSPDVRLGLERRGHRVIVDECNGGFGKGQCIWRLPAGDFVAGSESRCDGAAVGW